jgi:hypothetical protein
LNKLNKNKVAVDLIFVSFSIHIGIEIAFLIQTEILDEKLIAMKYIRNESLLIIPLLFIKFTEILTLFDSISPFVDIVFKILNDIVFFMLIFCITIFMAANCFYLIGRNQIFFDEISVEEFRDTDIGYDTLRKAIWYTWLLTLGEFNYDCFWLGN